MKENASIQSAGQSPGACLALHGNPEQQAATAIAVVDYSCQASLLTHH